MDGDPKHQHRPRTCATPSLQQASTSRSPSACVRALRPAQRPGPATSQRTMAPWAMFSMSSHGQTWSCCSSQTVLRCGIPHRYIAGLLLTGYTHPSKDICSPREPLDGAQRPVRCLDKYSSLLYCLAAGSPHAGSSSATAVFQQLVFDVSCLPLVLATRTAATREL